mgnify:CR=1 FL=1
MPSLDFLTLYIVIFLNSLTVCVVWAAFAYRYRPNPAALYWLLGMGLTVVGGAVLAIQGNAGAAVPAIGGNALIILGFAQFWIGLRRFDGQAGGQQLALAITALAACAMIVCLEFDRGRAVVYAAGQATVMGLSIQHLLRFRQPGVGAIVAVVAFAVAMLGQFMVIGSNISVLTGSMAFPIYYALASYALLCTVFSGAVWNLGFALMMIDRLQTRLAHLSETDELTGVANRRGLQLRLAQLGGQSEQVYSVALFDLDDFKPLNDRYGHAAGDRALAHLGRLLSNGARPTDFVGRLGGDEFCVVFPGTAHGEASRLAGSLRGSVAITPFEFAGEQIRLSASVGVAERAPDENDLDVVVEADKALYADKAKKAPRKGERRQTA